MRHFKNPQKNVMELINNVSDDDMDHFLEDTNLENMLMVNNLISQHSIFFMDNNYLLSTISFCI